jgi:hypothetical protein
VFVVMLVLAMVVVVLSVTVLVLSVIVLLLGHQPERYRFAEPDAG